MKNVVYFTKSGIPTDAEKADIAKLTEAAKPLFRVQVMRADIDEPHTARLAEVDAVCGAVIGAYADHPRHDVDTRVVAIGPNDRTANV